MLLRSASLRPGPEVRSYSTFLRGGAMFFGLCAALVPLGAARALWDGDVAEAVLVSVMGLLTIAGAYAFAKAYRVNVVVCRREGRHLRIITASDVSEAEAGEAMLFVRKVSPATQHLPHHEVCLILPQRREPIVLFGSLVAGRALRRAELLGAHLGLAITSEPAPSLDWREFG